MKNFPLDTNAYAAARYHFDVEQGFAKFHENCRTVFRRRTDCVDAPLLNNHFQRFQVLNGADCAELQAKLADDDRSLNDNGFARNLLRRIITPEVDKAIISYFQSEYLPWWVSYNRNDVGFNDPESFLWHFDAGPTRHLKILAYFIDSNESGGGTQIMDVASSARYREAGYAFPYVKHRLADLAPLARALDLPHAPQLLHMKEGQILLFNPMNILHRAMAATKRPRYLMQIYIIPSPEKWLPYSIKKGFPEVKGSYGGEETDAG